MEQVNVSEFKAICLRLLERVRQTGEPIEVLKNGLPLVVVYPPQKAAKPSAFGVLKATLVGPAGDLMEPVAGDQWEVLGGKPLK